MKPHSVPTFPSFALAGVASHFWQDLPRPRGLVPRMRLQPRRAYGGSGVPRVRGRGERGLGHWMRRGRAARVLVLVV